METEEEDEEENLLREGSAGVASGLKTSAGFVGVSQRPERMKDGNEQQISEVSLAELTQLRQHVSLEERRIVGPLVQRLLQASHMQRLGGHAHQSHDLEELLLAGIVQLLHIIAPHLQQCVVVGQQTGTLQHAVQLHLRLVARSRCGNHWKEKGKMKNNTLVLDDNIGTFMQNYRVFIHEEIRYICRKFNRKKRTNLNGFH